jgi:hypothetical protein
MKNIILQLHSYSKKTFKKLKTQSLSHKTIGVIRELEHWIGMIIIKRELNNLNEYSTNLIQRLSKNYQPHQKKSNFICVYSSASAYNLTHNEISANIEKHQKISELRWNDELIEYICNH